MLKWGIIGLGRIADKFAHDLDMTTGSELVAVGSRSLSKGEEFARKWQVGKAYGSYEDLVQDREVDIVYIATPHHKHVEWTGKCMDAGKHVLCEKPMALSSHEIDELVRKANENRVFLMEAIWTAFIPSFIQALSIIRSGEIGKISHVHADFGFRAHRDPNNRLFNRQLAGGALWDIGIYPIFLALEVLGAPERIHSSVRYAETGVDSWMASIFEYNSGERAVLESTFDVHTPCMARVYGEYGSLTLQAPFHHSEGIILESHGHPLQESKFPIQGLGYVHEIEHVQECIQKGLIESPILPWSKSLELARVMEEVRRGWEN